MLLEPNVIRNDVIANLTQPVVKPQNLITQSFLSITCNYKTSYIEALVYIL